uniref:Uncharacterized protein n=1 Tax=Candidatus Kentrum sp. LFY TaxID=2126342 RepID=A0A450UD29_9GAMM|nr:MAG: hypothetical protein BECKLFY1418B_GA0070995_101928 [Candidatus Kentron sp. LFY]
MREPVPIPFQAWREALLCPFPDKFTDHVRQGPAERIRQTNLLGKSFLKPLRISMPRSNVRFPDRVKGNRSLENTSPVLEEFRYRKNPGKPGAGIRAHPIEKH